MTEQQKHLQSVIQQGQELAEAAGASNTYFAFAVQSFQ